MRRSQLLLCLMLRLAIGAPASGQDFFGAGVITASTAARAGIYLPSSDNVLDALIGESGVAFGARLDDEPECCRLARQQPIL